MATYNSGRHIVPSVQSVLRQTLQDFELLIVGDGCTDDTEAAIRPFLSDRVSFCNQAVHSGSQSAPNNLGIAAPRGMNVAFIGHDDIWSADHLASLQALFAMDPGLHFLR
jgi:glycosyltransferase involved in cell wall biosynthesis